MDLRSNKQISSLTQFYLGNRCDEMKIVRIVSFELRSHETSAYGQIFCNVCIIASCEKKTLWHLELNAILFSGSQFSRMKTENRPFILETFPIDLQVL